MTSLDPHKISTVYEQNIVLDLFEGLTTVDEAGRPIPGVAESWSMSADGLTWTFQLRKKLTWSDGIPLTAEDVVYSFRRLMNPATASQYPYLLYAVENGRAVNSGSVPATELGVTAQNGTVLINLSSPLPNLPELLSNGFAAIVPRHAIEEHGDTWATPGRLVANGAYTLSEWLPQDHVTLDRNRQFRDFKTTAFDRVVYRPTEDQAAALNRFRAGELDTNLEFPSARTQWLLENLQSETRIADQLATFYLALNTSSPKLADARVRRSLSLAIDRRTLADRVLRSGERAATSFVPPAIADYAPAVDPMVTLSLAERQSQARELLNAAGYGPSNPLRLSYSLSSAEDRQRVAAAIAAMWRPLGVEVTLNNTEGRVLFSQLRTGDFEIGYAAWVADVNDAANFLGIFHSESTTSNYARYQNLRFDVLFNQAISTADLKIRATLLKDAEQIILDETPVVPLFHGVSKNLVADHLRGWVDNPKDIHLSRFLSRTP